MQPPVIAALIAATVALITATLAAIASQRQASRIQRNNWMHERRKDAYLGFIDAARAFLPLTEVAVRGVVHPATEPAVTHYDGELIDGSIVFTEVDRVSDALYIIPAELSEAWYEDAPDKLTKLTAAWDRVHLDGSSELRALAQSMNREAHYIANSRELIPLDLKRMDPEQELIPSEATLLREDIRAYHAELREFIEKAREDLNGPAPKDF
ncbi:hypothetical protein [Streptomyces parvus]|uniref:hypothetical protein n=1 Tax=Streptomyces parvus TaxID=66428 RepID=UPI003329B678